MLQVTNRSVLDKICSLAVFKEVKPDEMDYFKTSIYRNRFYILLSGSLVIEEDPSDSKVKNNVENFIRNKQDNVYTKVGDEILEDTVVNLDYQRHQMNSEQIF